MTTPVRCAVLLLIAATPAAGDDKRAAKDAADGWLNLFDGETTFGWTVIRGTAVAKDGRLVIGGEAATRVEYPPLFGDCEVEVHYEAAAGRPPAKVPVLRLDKGDPHPMSGKGEAGRTWVGAGVRMLSLSVEVPAGESCALT